jgi:hypothetical protein
VDQHEAEGQNNRAVKVWVVMSPNAGIEPLAVMVESCNALVTVFAMHRLFMYAGFTHPAIFGVLFSFQHLAITTIGATFNHLSFNHLASARRTSIHTRFVVQKFVNSFLFLSVA